MRGSCASLPRSHSTAGSGVPPPGLVCGAALLGLPSLLDGPVG
jgi:hypothetical protein